MQSKYLVTAVALGGFALGAAAIQRCTPLQRHLPM